ncbi:hypothetical protein GR157_14000 [Burkholderia sp. 4701]|nr:hypothetical protein [Burkholderia sp. 4701]MXN85509.1 hypothetical protein [Burkholderia sp. 4812]
MIETAEIPTIDDEPRRVARAFYWKGRGITWIAQFLNVPRSTVESWKQYERARLGARRMARSDAVLQVEGCPSAC